MAMTCYTDVGGDLAEIVLSPATLVSTAEKWVAFTAEWDRCLNAFGVTALHMKDFAHSRREFESWRWDEPKRRRFLRALIAIIDEYVEYTAAVAVYNDDYNKVNAMYLLGESMRPYTMGCLGCAARIKVWSKVQKLDWNDFIWLYEKGDVDQNDLRLHWRIAYPEGDTEPIFKFKKDKYLSNECKRIRPFEAADLIGYENLHAHRLLERKQGNPKFEELRFPMQRMFDLKGADKWGYFSEAEMLASCAGWGIPSRVL